MNTHDDILKKYLFDNCDDKKSGTVFISTLNNKSCQIVLKEGVIISFSLGRTKGIDAVLELIEVGCKSASLNESLKTPLTEGAKILSSEKVLTSLGYVKRSTSTQKDHDIIATNEAPSQEKSGVFGAIFKRRDKKKSTEGQTYRGQVIAHATVKPQESNAADANVVPTIMADKKSVRMYRGQIIED